MGLLIGFAGARRTAPVILSVAFLAVPASPVAGDWPQWRGPERDGATSAPLFAGEPPDRLERLWQREIGDGYAGPVVAGERVWVHSREGGLEVVRSLRLADGAVVWSRSYEAPFRQDEDAFPHGLGPFSTPALAGGRLFTFGVNAVLIAWSADNGELLWRRDSADEFDPGFPYFGAAASPLVWRDLCFVHLGGHERGRIDNPGEGAMVALSVADGRERWRWSGDGPSMGASPVIGEIDGQAQLVFKSKKLLLGLDPETGRELWRVAYQVPMDNTIVTPLLLGDRLLTSDFDSGVFAWRIVRDGASWAARPIWRHREVSLFTSSPVVAGGLMVGSSHLRRGQLFALDPDDGRVLWRGPPRRGQHASLIGSGSQVLAFQEDGTLLLSEVSRDGLRPIGRFELGGRSVAWAHPAVVGDRIVFRDGRRLVASRLERAGSRQGLVLRGQGAPLAGALGRVVDPVQQ